MALDSSERLEREGYIIDNTEFNVFLSLNIFFCIVY